MAERVRLDTPSIATETPENQSDSSEKTKPGVDSAERIVEDECVGSLERTQTHAKEIWKFRLRPADDDEPQ